MDCFHARLLFTFAQSTSRLRNDAHLDADEQAQLQSHLDGCDECRELATRESQADQLLVSAMRRVPEPPAGLESKILQSLRRQQRPNPWTWGAAAAAVLLAIGLGIGWYIQSLPTTLDVNSLVRNPSPSRETVSNWFRNQGLRAEPPLDLDIGYLTSYDVAVVQGRRVPKLTYVNFAREATAHVYVISNRDFRGLDEFVQNQASPGNRVEVLDPADGSDVRYLVIYPAGSREAFQRPGGGA